MGLASSALSGACCVANSVMCGCRLATCCCSGGRAEGSWRMAKLGYLALFALSVLLSLLMKYYGADMNIGVSGMRLGCTGGGGEAFSHCFGDGAVFRVSFCLFMFFCAQLLGTLLGGNHFHSGFWGLKVALYVAALVVSLWIPNSFFFVDDAGGGRAWYMWFSRVVSMLFLVLQIVMLIDFAYEWNRLWVSKGYDEYGEVRNKNWLVAVLACAGGMYVACLVGLVLLFVYYDGCGINNFFTAVTLISVVALTGMSLFRDKIAGQEGAILPAAVVAVYCVYLCWSALQSNPDAACHPDASSFSSDPQDDDSTQIVIGLLVTTLSLTWTSYSASANGSALFGDGDDAGASQADLTKPIYEVEEGGKIPDVDDESNSAEAPTTELQDRKKAREERRAARKAARAAERGGGVTQYGSGTASDEEEGRPAAAESQERLWFFHLILMSAAVYMAMLLTDWASGSVHNGQLKADVGKTSMWVKILSEWMTIGLYIWTLIAPRCMPSREWE